MDNSFVFVCPTMSGHKVSWARTKFAGVYNYDPTDDGPECEVVTRILAHYPQKFLDLECEVYRRQSRWPLGRRSD